MSKSKGILALNKAGQSIWYDNLSKAVLESGKLAELIAKGVSGLTSNPAIFKKSIADSKDYDADLQKLKGGDVETVTESMMLKDVTKAADLLAPVYRETKAADGYASVEVSPALAHDTNGTITAARRIWHTVARENLMVKIPATKAGIPAIEQVLEDGINVNVTLIFSVERYLDVAQAYVRAIKKRIDKGLAVDRLSSVASFFVSRVDAVCEKRFAELVKAGKADAAKLNDFIGKVGIDNSLLAYKSFQEIFQSEAFDAMAAKGAMVQRPLWASTGTKNPDFDPLLYVRALSLPSTVNTLPPDVLEKTILADSFSNEINSLKGCGKYMAMMADLGIDMKSALIELEEQGVKSFSDAYTELLQSVSQKMEQV